MLKFVNSILVALFLIIFLCNGCERRKNNTVQLKEFVESVNNIYRNPKDLYSIWSIGFSGMDEYNKTRNNLYLVYNNVDTEYKKLCTEVDKSLISYYENLGKIYNILLVMSVEKHSYDEILTKKCELMNKLEIEDVQRFLDAKKNLIEYYRNNN